ncbi:MAG: Ig-like domain-containing protein, partial [Clostridia bacterium]|nr:Ig-like domain-containing protein [Clostridia bacterium]
MDGVQDVEIIGCHIHNVAASGLHIGDQRYTNPKIANPPEPEQRLSGFTVNNNYIHDIGQDFYASCGVVLGFVGDAEFRHNELYNMPYSGYHIGYGFGEQGATALGNITVANNYIHDVMMKLVDGGYIYTNGSTQANDPIELDFHENYCYNSGGTTTIALYNDTGTDYCTWNNNVVNIINTTGMMAVGNSSARVPECYYKNTYTTHDYVYGDIPSKEKAWGDVYLYPDANWPEEAMEIIAKSGLEEEYQYLVETDDSLNMVTTESVLLMDSGDTASVGLKAYTDRGKACNVSELDVTYTSDDETIASVDANGMITAVSQGKVNITATAAEGDFTQTRTTEVYVDDHFDRVIMDDMSDRLVVGAEIYTKLAGETKFGRPVAVTASIKSSDPDILSVDEKGVIRALKQGEGHVEITGEYEGKSITSVYTISVMDYADQSGTEYPEHSIEGIIKSTEGWELMSENGSITPTVDGLQFATPAGYALYTQEQYQDELFTFDLTLTGGSWPSIAFRQQANLGYADAGNALYMLSFSKGTVDLQRFNRGVRTGILYSGAADIITGGPALPLALERGKTYKVQAGAINEENGVRIIVNIDGKNVINFLDTVEGCIKEPGYFGVYCTSGSMDFAPAE